MMKIWKSGKILKFLVPVKIWIRIDISDYLEIFSRGENLA